MLGKNPRTNEKRANVFRKKQFFDSKSVFFENLGPNDLPAHVAEELIHST